MRRVTAGIRLGRIFGIEISFNLSLVFIFGLIAWTLAQSELPVEAPHQPAAAYWLTALTGAVAFYACLLAHELSHSLVARSRGMSVKGITLWLFGGVSQLEGEPRSAQAEALITAVGPATSIVLAGAAYGLTLLAGATAAPALVVALLTWLAYFNAALAVFNLVPAFPLDGGRLLSSLLWWRSGSRLRGIHSAVRVGRVLALLMIAVGVFEVFAGDPLGGIWIAFIGWFLLSAGTAEDAGAMTKALLTGVPVRAAMTSPAIAVPEWLTVEQFLSSLAPTLHHSTYPLHDLAGQLSGVTRLPDLLRVPRAQRDRIRLLDCAVPIAEMPRATGEDDLEGVLERIGPAGLERRVLVFDAGRLAGIVSPTDIARLVKLRQAARTGGQTA